MIENLFRQSLERKQFTCTAELVLGRDQSAAEAEAFVRDAAADPTGMRIISLTDLPGGNPALLPEGFLSFVLEHALVPIVHLTGKDCNRACLEGRLYTLERLGVENVLALTGDAQKEGFLGMSKPVFDLDSALILRLIEEMRSGVEYRLGGRSFRSTPFAFFSGCVVNPFKVREPDLMMQYFKLELKIRSGARFVIPQLGYNLRKLHELRLYLEREGLGHIPVLANVYVPTATIARLMRAGELAGCVIPDTLIARLEKEKKPERLERAACWVAAARDLGFAGAHLGGFGLTHRDFVTIRDRAAEMGSDWRKSLDNLRFEFPGEHYLLPEASDGLSDPSGSYQIEPGRQHPSILQWISRRFHDAVIAEESPGSKFLRKRLRLDRLAGDQDLWRSGSWYRLLGTATLYRKATLGCMSCGDCIQDHLNYAGCTMKWCYKNLRNGPCGGSRIDGACEAHPDRPCIWNQVYAATRNLGEDPRKYARTLLPPRDWSLDQTNALANRLARLDHTGKALPEISSGPRQEIP